MRKINFLANTALAMVVGLSFASTNVLARTGTMHPAVAKQVTPLGGPDVTVGPQYDTTHVYVNPDKREEFVKSFLGTFGGKSTNMVEATVTPTPSKTASQLLLTPVGTLSVFGFLTPIPYPFGAERTGYLVKNLDQAIQWAQQSGAHVVVSSFKDPIGRDAVIQFPGGVNTQLYWHFKTPSYDALHTIPENRVYLTPKAADAFVQSFLKFSRGRVLSDIAAAPGIEIGRPNTTYRHITLYSGFGKVSVIVTEGFLPYPYGHEMTGYEVSDFQATIKQAKEHDVKILAGPYSAEGKDGAILQFPGGYIAEIHTAGSQPTK